MHVTYCERLEQYLKSLEKLTAKLELQFWVILYPVLLLIFVWTFRALVQVPWATQSIIRTAREIDFRDVSLAYPLTSDPDYLREMISQEQIIREWRSYWWSDIYSPIQNDFDDLHSYIYLLSHCIERDYDFDKHQISLFEYSDMKFGDLVNCSCPSQIQVLHETLFQREIVGSYQRFLQPRVSYTYVYSIDDWKDDEDFAQHADRLEEDLRKYHRERKANYESSWRPDWLRLDWWRQLNDFDPDPVVQNSNQRKLSLTYPVLDQCVEFSWSMALELFAYGALLWASAFLFILCIVDPDDPLIKKIVYPKLVWCVHIVYRYLVKRNNAKRRQELKDTIAQHVHAAPVVDIVFNYYMEHVDNVQAWYQELHLSDDNDLLSHILYDRSGKVYEKMCQEEAVKAQEEEFKSNDEKYNEYQKVLRRNQRKKKKKRKNSGKCSKSRRLI